MALILAKNGNPVIFVQMEEAPKDFWEILFAVWPTSWGIATLLLMLLAAFPGAKFQKIQPAWLLWLPLAWAFWTLLSYRTSVAPPLSELSIRHFWLCVAVFYLGIFALGRLPNQTHFFRVIIFAFLFIFWVGLEQKNGGLEATRKAFYEQPGWQNAPPEYLLKIQSNRIFATFVYPNALASAILLWVPALMVVLWEWSERVPRILRGVTAGIFGYTALGCLFWSGSKAGWLIAIAVAAVALLHLPMRRFTKLAIITAVIVLGLTGFAIKFRSYFQKGATSASARVIYWKAAVQIANEHPVFGAGPGTFAKTFAPVKPPEAEMARLTHNDYLEQACDSGWPAFALFTSFIVAALAFGHQSIKKSRLHFAVWLGLLAWALQSFVEFGLYIPAISWSAFLLLGWLLAGRMESGHKAPGVV